MKRESTIIWVATFLLIGVWIGSKFSPQQASKDKLGQFFNYLQNEYVEKLDVDSLQAEAMNHILSSLDPHSTYIPVEEGAAMAERMQGGFSGVGVEFAIKKDSLVFVHVMENGPAAAAGVRSGDRVFAINGDTIVGDQLTNTLITSKIKGPRATTIQLDISRKGTLLTLSVQRDLVPISSVMSLPVDDGIGYIRVDRFAETTHDEFVAHLHLLAQEGMKQLIIDLRDNPGGYLHEAVAVADEFLSDNQIIVTTKYRNGTVNVSKAKSGQEFEKLPVSILINENSASASEVFTGALQDHDRATVFGKLSYGKGLVQEDKRLQDGSKVRLTVAYYFTPSGRSIQKPFRENQVVNEGVFLSDSGKVLYSGGGIEPDVSLGEDSVSYFWTFSFGTIDAFAFEYVDSTRVQFENAAFEDFITEYTADDALLDTFLEFGGYGIALDDLSASDTKELRTLMQAAIAKNYWGFDAYRKVLLNGDPVLKELIAQTLK